jgi:predicted hydrocarbon binding protein
VHGSIFVSLKDFVESGFGPEAWTGILNEAGMGGRSFEMLQTYADEDALAIVGAASEATGKSSGEILEAFGVFLAPRLLQMYWGAIEPDWRTLDVIEHTEDSIHRVVRMDHAGAAPPELVVERVAPEKIVLTYSSARRMCALALGLTRGLSDHFKERIELEESQCMHRGADSCVINITKS